MIKRTPALALLFVMTATAPAVSANPYGFSDEMDQGLKDGFQQLFNLQFEEAEKTIASLPNSKKERPMAALADVVRLWWQLSIDVMEGDEKASRPFLESAERCLKISNEAISQGDSRGAAHLAMGTTLGLMSRWSATNRAWIAAYLRGSKSSSYLEKALLKNKKALDAYMCLGTFNYAREMIMNRSGTAFKDPDDVGKAGVGLAQLRMAYEGAPYFRQAAGMMLAGILTNEDPKNALPLLRELRAELPQSGFVHMVLVTALFNAGDDAAMEVEAEDLRAKVEAGAYPPTFKPQAYFAKGLIALRQKDWKSAAELFGTASEIKMRRNPYVTWAHLYQGYAFDALGQRKRALEKYRLVLQLPRRFASHDHARARLEKPFRPGAPEMKKLEV